MDHDNTYTTDDKATKEQGKQLPTPLKLELDAALGVSGAFPYEINPVKGRFSQKSFFFFYFFSF